MIPVPEVMSEAARNNLLSLENAELRLIALAKDEEIARLDKLLDRAREGNQELDIKIEDQRVKIQQLQRELDLLKR